MDDLTTLETDLGVACERLAQVLAQPPEEGRTGALRAVAGPLFQRRAAYQQVLQKMRGARNGAVAHTHLRDADERLKMWSAVEQLVARQSWSSSFPPLLTRQDDLHRRRSGGVVNAAMQALFDLSNASPDADAKTPNESYGDIPLSGALFVELLTAAQRLLLAQGHTGPMRFLDMGCGAGSKLVAASGAFDQVHGVEFNPAYVASGRAFLKRCGLQADQIETADALTFDGYDAFDVIYFYRPLKDPKLAAQMEARVLEQARPGAVILAPLSLTIGRSNESAARIEDPIYVAQATRQQARELRMRAISIGCERRPHVSHDIRRLGFWAPVIMQSRANGFDLP